MKISTLKKKGIYHLNHNEDELFVVTNIQGKCLLAVMDGCGTAMESHWASGLVKKILRKEVETLKKENERLSSEELGRLLFQGVFEGVKKIRDLLKLDEIELFTTLLMAIVDPVDRSFVLWNSGDGFYSVDGEHFEIDCNNTPDFFTYHLEESFDSFFSGHVTQVSGKIDRRFLLATDGIDKFNDLDQSYCLKQIRNEGILKVMEFPIEPDSLSRRYERLRKEKALYPFDDLAIIAVELDQES